MPPTTPHPPPSYALGRDALGPFDPDLRTGALGTEWLLTNGLGSYAMGTALGVPTRKYHGLLVAAMNPPAQRTMTLAHLGDRLVFDAPSGPAEHRLALFHFADEDTHPHTSKTLGRFDKSDHVCWTHWLPCGSAVVEVTKQVRLCDRHNAVEVRYTIGPTQQPWTLTLKPLVALRDHHDLCAQAQLDDLSVEFVDAHTMRINNESVCLSVQCKCAQIEQNRTIWSGLHYAWEARRGQDSTEDLLKPGRFVIEHDGKTPKEITLVAWAGQRAASGSEPSSRFVEPAPDSLTIAARQDRRWAMTHAAIDAAGQGLAGQDQRTIARLAHAADDFIVERTGESDTGVSVVAGYPWFMDWGRDTMIALPGLLLTTGRHDEALRTLTTFARARRDGMIPNRFDDDDGPAHYNTIDASLWFIHACCVWLKQTAQRDAFMNQLLPACVDIIDAYEHGTGYAIAADPADGLITGGNADTQLTWMDAKRDGICFTPRHGKPVEINALWHNALGSLAEALDGCDDECATNLRAKARRVQASFVRAFAGGPGGGLVDCLTPDGTGGWTRSTELRPNQIFAASLPHAPLDRTAARKIVGAVTKHLLTPMGLRTLAPSDPGYIGRFEGKLFERDGAYHNGTVWPWLLGPYAEGVMRSGAFSPESRAEARRAIDPIINELDGTSVGQLWEVYDADTPQRPDGCIAQAWSVAEVLRVLVMALRS